MFFLGLHITSKILILFCFKSSNYCLFIFPIFYRCDLHVSMSIMFLMLQIKSNIFNEYFFFPFYQIMGISFFAIWHPYSITWSLLSNSSISITYLMLHPIKVPWDLEIQPNLIETIWKWELKFKVVKWFQHDCFSNTDQEQGIKLF